jgi:hypothetical protein
MVLISGRDVCERGQVVPVPVLASAAFDRTFEQAEIHCFNGKGDQLKVRIAISDPDTPPRTKK